MKKTFVLILINCLLLLTLPSFNTIHNVNSAGLEPDSNNNSITWKNLDKKEKQFIDKIEKRSFEFFWDGTDPVTGLGNVSSISKSDRVSIASEGFALSAICIADTRGWISHKAAYKRVLLVLNSFYKDPDNKNDFCVQGNHGLFYHFVNRKTGKRHGRSEVSTIDSGILMAGILQCMEHFKGTEIEGLARKIYLAADWKWFLRPDGGIAGGWSPERGIFGEFKGYNEYILVYLMGLGSPTHPIPASSWDVYASTYHWIKPYKEIGRFLTSGRKMRPEAYLYQFPACWVDFRGKKDHYADYWQNGVNALKANRRYCLNWGKQNNYPDKQLWGWTACAGKDGYQGFGKPYNGTVAPSAVAASLPFIPDLALPALNYMYRKYSDKIWGKYGFVDSFNPGQNWYYNGYLGIDEGNTVLMLENFRSGIVWKEFMQVPYVQNAMKKAGFVSTTLSK